MYRKEDLKFLNMDATITISKEKVFAIENELSIEEKINFIDELKNGIATYLLNILSNWENEKDSLPKDNYGSVKTVSKKAWIKRNDERKIIDVNYKIGSYYLFGTDYKKMSLICLESAYGHRYLYTDDNIVNQWFHDLCRELYYEEKKYFKSINPVDIKISQLKEYAGRYRILFDSKKVNDIVWNNDEDVTEKELDIYLEAFKRIEEYVVNITNEVKEQIDKL